MTAKAPQPMPPQFSGIRPPLRNPPPPGTPRLRVAVWVVYDLSNDLWATGRRWPFRTSTQFSKAKLFLKEHEAFELVAQLEASFWVLRTSGAINCHGQLVRDSVPLPKMIADALRGRQMLRETANKFGARK